MLPEQNFPEPFTNELNPYLVQKTDDIQSFGFQRQPAGFFIRPAFLLILPRRL